MTPELEALERLACAFKLRLYNLDTELEQVSRRSGALQSAAMQARLCIDDVEAEITKLKEAKE